MVPDKNIKQTLQQEALKIVFLEFVITMILALCMAIISFQKGFSVLLGGACYIAPNFLFAYFVFKFASARMAQEFMIAFLVGELLKLVLSAFFFILIVKNMDVNVVYVMAGYIIAIVSFWFVCGWHFGRSAS